MVKHFFGYLSFIIYFLLAPAWLTAQTANTAQPGPRGIFLTLGKTIPNGKSTLSYRIEKKVKDGAWMPLAEVKFPVTYSAFKSRLEKARVVLPAQPFPSEPKLKAMYDKAAESPRIDSLGKRIQIPVRLALGVIYYDADVQNDNVYQYRVTETSSTATPSEPVVSNSVAIPFTAKFDDILLAETSRDENSAYIRWRSAGTNPAPLFMVFRIEDKKPVAASGLTGHYSMNDTTYYTFQDSLGTLKAARELQYFLAPYDLLGNPGKQSQTAVITRDNFIKAFFMLVNISKLTERTGNRISWHFSDPVTSRSIELYRSENPDIGFQKVASLTPADTVYADEMIHPDRGYYYYIQANSRNGNRFKQSDKIYTPPCMPVKPQPPLLKSATTAPGGVKLLIEVTEAQVGGVRIFRNDGVSGSQSVVSGLIPKTTASQITFIDSSSSLSGRRTYTYAARTESTGNIVSDLSNTLTARPGLSLLPQAPSFFKAFIEGNTVKLYWEDMRQSDTGIAGYVVFRRIETAGQALANPFSPISGEKNLVPANSFTDSTLLTGNVYTYAIQAVDTENKRSTEKSMATVSMLGNSPAAPVGISVKNTRNGIQVEWIQLSYKDLRSFKLYRYQKGQAPTLLSTLPATATNAADPSALKGQQYYYFLTTLNSAGKESGHSEEAGVMCEN